MKDYGKAKKYESGETRDKRCQDMAVDIIKVFETHGLSCNAALSVLAKASSKVLACKESLDKAYFGEPFSS